jgi:thioredoxin-related protein
MTAKPSFTPCALPRWWWPMVCLALMAGVGWGAKPAWVYSFDEGMDLARQNQTLAMVYLFSGWSHWCTELDRTTFQDKTVMAALKKMACVKISGDTENELVDRLQVFGFPTILFLNGDEEVVGRIGGYIGPREFCGKIAMVTTLEEEYQRLRVEIQTDSLSAEKNYALGSLYVDREKYESAVPYFQQVVRLDSANTLGFTEKARLQMAYARIELMQYDQALAELAACDTLYPASSLADQRYLFRGLAEFHAGRLAAARQALEELVRRFPKSHMAEQAEEIIETIEQQEKNR